MCAALADADVCMAASLAAGRSDFFIPACATSYAVHGDFAQGQAVPVNPALLSLFKHNLRPSFMLGLSIREAAALGAFFRGQTEALSYSIWVLSGLLAFIRLQHFAPENSSLFNTLVTSLFKGLAHQASLSASHTAFLTLKRRQFYLFHLLAYFSDVNKRAVLSSAVCVDLLFNPLTPNPYCTESLPCAEGLGGAAPERNKRFFPKITARLVFKIKSSFFSFSCQWLYFIMQVSEM